MINIICFPNDTHYLVPLSQYGCVVFLSECLTYPFDRVATRQRARIFPNSSSFQLFKEIIVAEGLKGLYKGFKVTCDRTIAKNLTTYLIFNYLYNNYAFRHLVIQDINHNKNSNSTPDLKYIELNNGLTIGIIAISQYISLRFTQSRNVIQIKIQGDALKSEGFQKQSQHIRDVMFNHFDNKKVFKKPGFYTGLMHSQLLFMGEILMFQYLLIKNDYTFINLHNGSQSSLVDLGKVSLYAGIASATATAFAYPLQLIQNRHIVRALRNNDQINIYKHLKQIIESENIYGLYKGILPTLTKNVLSSVLTVGFLWNSALKSKQSIHL